VAVGGDGGGGGGRRAACEPTEAEWWEALRSVQPSGLLGLIEAPADAADAAAAAPPPPPPPPLGSLGPPAGVDDGGAGGDGWAAVGGLEGVKRRLRLLLQAPLVAAPLCAQLGLGVVPPGVLLYGPPGTGKTLLVRVLANPNPNPDPNPNPNPNPNPKQVRVLAAEAGLNLIAVAIPQLVKPEVGASERALASLFERARAHAPCLLFLDELQSIFGRRGAVGRVGKQLLSQLLLELDATQAGAAGGGPTVALVGATNAPEALDSALLRPGRLEHALYIGPPRRAARAAILRRQLRRMPLRLARSPGGEAREAAAIASVDDLARELAARTARFSGADLLALCQRAAMAALQRAGTAGTAGAAGAAGAALSVELERPDFEQALREVSPSLTAEMLERLHAWAGSRSSSE